MFIHSSAAPSSVTFLATRPPRSRPRRRHSAATLVEKFETRRRRSASVASIVRVKSAAHSTVECGFTVTFSEAVTGAASSLGKAGSGAITRVVVRARRPRE